jgi:glycosyltransferase involved in cell wall biosynthesis
MAEKIKLLLLLYYYLLKSKLLLFYLKLKSSNNDFNSKKEKSVLFLAAFYPENAGYHWRVKKWSEELTAAGYFVKIENSLGENDFNSHQKNLPGFLVKFLRIRYKQVKNSRNFETVIVRRELLIYNDYGNLFLDRLLLKIHPNAILDFDDDISAAKQHPKKITNWYAKLLLENGDKFNQSLNLYNFFIVASNYLKTRVLEQNSKISPDNVCVIPTCVDYNKYPIKDYSINKTNLTFGWIGGDHNYFLLDQIIPILDKLSAKYNFNLLVIGGENYKRECSFKIYFKKWSLDTEIENLLSIDIGLMPLDDSIRAKGKGGFKLIQYMGLGIVSIASSVTINKEIVDDRVNSFLVCNDDEWYDCFSEILSGQININEFGKRARIKIEENYTIQANIDNYLSFLRYVRKYNQ